MICIDQAISTSASPNPSWVFPSQATKVPRVLRVLSLQPIEHRPNVVALVVALVEGRSVRQAVRYGLKDLP